ncbi:hypothetical protein RM609_10460 [Streptomyces sp. DSM 40473]|uniref:Uncharacterized protein n=1 Tax=Streptomyces hesseae TaxID=3075519 RepID=A0ABU2SLI0_9ACTN|nr:hypothetical protein [Streptomyces sp. DSM 40473]MDT0449491.1 hypothetical protein [Streptomyces sp. DSM 40473]
MGKQYLGSAEKIDRGVITVTTCWADDRLYYLLNARPYIPAHHFPGGKNDPNFRTAVLEKHGNLDRFGLCLLHDHFPVASDEVLVETHDADARRSASGSRRRPRPGTPGPLNGDS